jgi:hypothetical protein
MFMVLPKVINMPAANPENQIRIAPAQMLAVGGGGEYFIFRRTQPRNAR